MTDDDKIVAVHLLCVCVNHFYCFLIAKECVLCSANFFFPYVSQLSVIYRICQYHMDVEIEDERGGERERQMGIYENGKKVEKNVM